jgi:hypothetical protein
MASAARGAAIVAELQRRDAACSGCHGSGRKDYGFGERSCDYCNGSGLHIDECRQELVDAIGDKLADTNDLDVGWTQFARAVLALLEERGADVVALARP